jgi:hypothetical protein
MDSLATFGWSYDLLITFGWGGRGRHQHTRLLEVANASWDSHIFEDTSTPQSQTKRKSACEVPTRNVGQQAVVVGRFVGFAFRCSRFFVCWGISVGSRRLRTARQRLVKIRTAQCARLSGHQIRLQTNAGPATQGQPKLIQLSLEDLGGGLVGIAHP